MECYLFSGSLEQNMCAPSFHDSHTQSFYDRHTTHSYDNHTPSEKTEISRETDADEIDEQKQFTE
jgi:hypothetical protein